MKKAFIISIISVFLLIALNIYYYRDTFNWQIATQRNILKKELLICNDEIGQFFDKTQTNVLLLLTIQEMDHFFKDPGKSIETQKRLELLYNRYSDFLKELKVYNNKGISYTMRKGPNNTYIGHFEVNPIEDEFTTIVSLDSENNQIRYLQPLKSDNQIFGFVEFTIDMHFFFDDFMRNFNLEQYQFQWIIHPNGHVIYSTIENLNLTLSLADIVPQLKYGQPFDQVHPILINNSNTSVISVFQPLNFNGEIHYLVFSLPTALVTASIAKNSFLVGGISVFVIVIIITFFGIYIKKKN